MSWATRKIAMKLTPTIVYRIQSETELSVEFQTIVKNMEQTYTVPGKTKHKGMINVSLFEFNGIRNFL